MNLFSNYSSETKTNDRIIGIYETVCDYYGIPMSQANSITREQPILRCRQVAHYLAREITKASFYNIGLIIARKKHAGVMNSIKVINNLITPLSNGSIPDRCLLRDIEILRARVQKANFGEDRYWNSIGTMITNQL